MPPTVDISRFQSQRSRLCVNRCVSVSHSNNNFGVIIFKQRWLSLFVFNIEQFRIYNNYNYSDYSYGNRANLKRKYKSFVFPIPWEFQKKIGFYSFLRRIRNFCAKCQLFRFKGSGWALTRQSASQDFPFYSARLNESHNPHLSLSIIKIRGFQT